MHNWQRGGQRVAKLSPQKTTCGSGTVTYVPVPIITQMIKAGNNMQCIDSSSNRRRDLHAKPVLYPISICLPWTLLTISFEILLCS